MSNKKTTEEIQTLIEQNLNLANKLAVKKKKSMPKSITFEELQSAAFLGLTEAANRFNPELGFCFSTYAYPRISGAINDYLRELGLTVLSLEETSDESDLCLKDTIVTKKTSNETFEFAGEVLGKQAGDMLKLYYLNRFSMKEIGEMYDYTEGRVSQLISGYKKSIKEHHNKAA